jgi:hypothetical protein
LGDWITNIYSTHEINKAVLYLKEIYKNSPFFKTGDGLASRYLFFSGSNSFGDIEKSRLPKFYPWWDDFIKKQTVAYRRYNKAFSKINSLFPKSNQPLFTFSWSSQLEASSVKSTFSNPALDRVEVHSLVLDHVDDTAYLTLLKFCLTLADRWHTNQGGLILHSSAVARGEDGFLFLGDSGSGKSTVARLSSSISRR